MDINEAFVRYAAGNGFQAETGDVMESKAFAPADVCVMTGSLYHIPESALGAFLEKIFRSSPKLIISEPVRNLASAGGLTGLLARSFSRTKLGETPFRYDRNSLLEALNKWENVVGFRYRIIGEYKKDLVILAEKKTT
jgi:hypothetical protein